MALIDTPNVSALNMGGMTYAMIAANTVRVKERGSPEAEDVEDEGGDELFPAMKRVG